MNLLRNCYNLYRRHLKPSGIGRWRPLVPEDEFSRSIAKALDRLMQGNGGTALGAYLEFGVSRGTSMACVYRVLEDRHLSHVQMIGFDSFEGMPEGSEAEGWLPGRYHSTVGATRRYLAARGVSGTRVSLVKGWFDQTLVHETAERLGLRSASLIMFDCDTYSSTRCALEFSLPLIDGQAVTVFDDWAAWEGKNLIGQKEAFQEFVADTGAFAIEPLQAYSPRARMFLLTRVHRC
jgi:O-methyltransferase